MIRTVLIIGSGPIVIGQAAEFDYSGTQAAIACREAGVRTVLVNSNPATIGTDPATADAVYIEPLTVPSLERIISRERPDGLIATVGGQTALNLTVALAEAGVLDRGGVRVLGTGLDAIRKGEDRALFAATLRGVGEPVLPSVAVSSIAQALAAAETIGYPVMCRSAFALGGAGSGFAHHRAELAAQVERGLAASGSGQVLIEKSVRGWSEIEYEVIRDAQNNCVIVCNMENVDPMGVHTGESVVVAPSQTLSDVEYHALRASAMAVVRALGVEGACNVQFALDRHSGRYYIIEVNPRLSRSSALASKATGYPIARVATQIALGASLPDIRNDITGTSALFEPALDYVVAKIPRWPFDKLTSASPRIGTSMRSTGEVMAIGRTFEEAMAKAVRSLDTLTLPPGDLRALLAEPTAWRLPAVLAALRSGTSSEEIAHLTGIHPWFTRRLAALDSVPTSAQPVYKMVDTCAGEFEARTPYFYSSHLPGGQNEADPLPGPKAIILGAGPIRIGQGIEFDYATVHACAALSASGVRSIIINNNPETVSTDFSTSDRLYFEPLDLAAVMAVVRNEGEGLLGVIPQFGGQTAINLVDALSTRDVPILGTPPAAIDAAEDRARASALLAQSDIPAPPWSSALHWQDVPAAVARVGFPALLRPSYVLSGRGMTVVRSNADVDAYISAHAHTPLAAPLLVDRFLAGATEVDVDAVSDGQDVVAVLLEQIEECGVHSGDSTEIYPPQSISTAALATIEVYTRHIARAFRVCGLMNVQFAVQGERVYVLEVNPRASRSIPFASKASGIPLADLAVRVILGARLRDLPVPPARTDHVCVKGVVLPFRVFPDILPVTGPEMQSTGESMGSGPDFASAYWKAWQGAGMKYLPFERPVYLTTPDPALEVTLRAAGCAVIGPKGDHPDDASIDDASIVVAVGRSEAEIDVLRRAVTLGLPTITDRGGVRGLQRAVSAGRPSLVVRPLTAAPGEDVRWCA